MRQKRDAMPRPPPDRDVDWRPSGPGHMGGKNGLANREKVGKGSPTARPQASGWKKLIFLPMASVFFVLGVLGAFLPGLPATPFLLLTSYFLVRSSPRLNQALLRSRLFGPILIDWQVHGGVRRDVKIKAVVFVVIAVAVTIFLFRYSWVATLLVTLLAVLGITVILRLPTAKPP